MIYKWINTDSNQISKTFTNNANYIARLDAFIEENNIEQDIEGRYIIDDVIRDIMLGGVENVVL